MKKIAFIILFLAAGTVTFAEQKKAKKAVKNPNEIQSVTVHRTACYGRCPEYTIEITKAGMATYTALRFNADTGIYKKSIGTKKAKEVFDQFALYHTDTCMEMYQNRIPDLPGIVYTIKYPGKTQKIFNANWGPAYLKELAKTMDDAGKKSGKGWKKTGMPKFQ